MAAWTGKIMITSGVENWISELEDEGIPTRRMVFNDKIISYRSEKNWHQTCDEDWALNDLAIESNLESGRVVAKVEFYEKPPLGKHRTVLSATMLFITEKTAIGIVTTCMLSGEY